MYGFHFSSLNFKIIVSSLKYIYILSLSIESVTFSIMEQKTNLLNFRDEKKKNANLKKNNILSFFDTHTTLYTRGFINFVYLTNMN